MAVEVWGMNHRSAPVAVREKVSVPPGDLERELIALRGCASPAEIAVVSTCNRFEIYIAPGSKPDRADIPAALTRRYGFKPQEIESYLYHYRAEEAVRHLFRVVTSLDSLVVGEAQIFGQVREAYRAAVKAGSIGPVLRWLFAEAFKTGREIRGRTRIGKGAISVSSLSIGLAVRLFGSLAGRRVLVIGAGRTGESAVRHLMSRGITSVTVANRTFDRARELAACFGGSAVRFEQLYDAMERSDLVIGSTGSPRPVVDAGPVRELMRRRGPPLLLIDIAVPRDIDPAVAAVPGVHLYNIDDLDRMREENMRERLTEAAMAERLVEERTKAAMHGFCRSPASEEARILLPTAL